MLVAVYFSHVCICGLHIELFCVDWVCVQICMCSFCCEYEDAYRCHIVECWWRIGAWSDILQCMDSMVLIMGQRCILSVPDVRGRPDAGIVIFGCLEIWI